MLFHKKKVNKIGKRRSSLALKIPRRITSLENDKWMNRERAVLCASGKTCYEGSLTVEAAVVTPLFLIAMFSLIFVIDLCRIHVIEQVELGEKAKKLGTYAYIASEYMNDPYVDLKEVYSYRLPVSLIPGYTINIAKRGRVHAWVGRTPDECETDKHTLGAALVYVTDHQAVYHTNSACTYLELSVYAIEGTDLQHVRNQSGGKYKACEKCCGDFGDSGTSDGETCYITRNGDRYHSSSSCSGLTRNVHLIPVTDVSGLSCCSRCEGS